MIASVKELHELDFGVHMHVMEEWNEGTEWDWQPAQVILHGYYTRVVQEDGIGGLHIATYVSHGEGDLVSLRVFTNTPKTTALQPAPYSREWVQKAVHRDHVCGSEYYFNEDRELRTS